MCANLHPTNLVCRTIHIYTCILPPPRQCPLPSRHSAPSACPSSAACAISNPEHGTIHANTPVSPNTVVPWRLVNLQAFSGSPTRTRAGPAPADVKIHTQNKKTNHSMLAQCSVLQLHLENPLLVARCSAPLAVVFLMSRYISSLVKTQKALEKKKRPSIVVSRYPHLVPLVQCLGQLLALVLLPVAPGVSAHKCHKWREHAQPQVSESAAAHILHLGRLIPVVLLPVAPGVSVHKCH